MNFKPSDFPGEYITPKLAAEIAQALFLKWAEANNICLHPQDKIRATRLAWDFSDCTWKCGVCEDAMVLKP